MSTNPTADAFCEALTDLSGPNEDSLRTTGQRNPDGSFTFHIRIGAKLLKKHTLTWGLAQRGSKKARAGETIEDGGASTMYLRR